MKALVLEGGGVLGAAQASALERLERDGLCDTRSFDIISGTSIGALNGLALACGFSPYELARLWLTIEEKEVAPICWWSPFLGRRRNYLPEFIIKYILTQDRIGNFDPEKITMLDIFKITGKSFYCTAYSLQKRSGFVFGPNSEHSINVPVILALKATTGHPLKFSPVPFKYNDGKIHDLVDGALFQNCPLMPFMFNSEVDYVFCVAISEAVTRHKRINKYKDVLFSIISGLVSSNEGTSYYYAWKRWKKNFHLINCSFSSNYGLFDFDKIPEILKIGEHAANRGIKSLEDYNVVDNLLAVELALNKSLGEYHSKDMIDLLINLELEQRKQ